NSMISYLTGTMSSNQLPTKPRKLFFGRCQRRKNGQDAIVAVAVRGVGWGAIQLGRGCVLVESNRNTRPWSQKRNRIDAAQRQVVRVAGIARVLQKSGRRAFDAIGFTGRK